MLNQLLLVLHFVGLAMGLSVTFANVIMIGLITKAAPSERAILGRFPPAMMRVGDIGLVLLWITGGTMLYTKWSGFAMMPWQFHAKITVVLLLTLVVGYIHSLAARIKRGDAGAESTLQTVGKIPGVLALIIVILAVLTFD